MIVNGVRAYYLFVLLCCVTSCIHDDYFSNGKLEEDPDIIEITGTVQYNSIEGGFYGIRSDDGRRYTPVNLPGKFKSDGLRIRALGTIHSDSVSFKMWGITISIEKIEAIE